MTKRNDISTPEGYFQDLQKRLQAIPTRETRPGVRQVAAPWLAFAASLAILAALGNFVFRQTAAPDQTDTGWDYISYLAQSLDPDGLIELTEVQDLSDEDIIHYLVADNISLEQLATFEDEEND
jgi:hypothetical protein